MSQTTPASCSNSPAGIDPHRVLVVDPRRALTIADLLELAAPGWPPGRATPAASADDARAHLASAAYDVIVLDAAWSGAASGDCRMLRDLRQIQPEVEFVLVGDFSNPDRIAQALSQGAYACFDHRLERWRQLRAIVRRAAEHKRTAAELRRRVQQAHVLEHAATVLHNFNGPLGEILGLAELEIKRLGAAAGNRIPRIAHAADRLRRMVRSLVDVARGGEPKVMLQPESFEEFWTACAPGLRTICERDAVQFDADVQFRGPAGLDAEKMLQAIEQLVINAVRAVGQRWRGANATSAKIAVRCRKTETNELTIAVEDNGVGMSEELAGRVLDALRPEDIRGAGLGLKFVREIVAQHGGRLEVASRKNHGTVFTITLPIAESVSAPALSPGMSEGV